MRCTQSFRNTPIVDVSRIVIGDVGACDGPPWVSRIAMTRIDILWREYDDTIFGIARAWRQRPPGGAAVSRDFAIRVRKSPLMRNATSSYTYLSVCKLHLH